MSAFISPEPVRLQAWIDDAICKEADVDFFPDAGREAEAVALCGICPVREQCLDYALRNEEAYGVWGGKTPKERRRSLAQKSVQSNQQPADPDEGADLAPVASIVDLTGTRRRRRPWYHDELQQAIQQRRHNNEALSDAVAIRHGVAL